MCASEIVTQVKQQNSRKWKRCFNEIIKVYDSILIPLNINWRKVCGLKIQLKTRARALEELSSIVFISGNFNIAGTLFRSSLSLEEIWSVGFEKISITAVVESFVLFLPRICCINKHFTHDSKLGQTHFFARLLFTDYNCVQSLTTLSSTLNGSKYRSWRTFMVSFKVKSIANFKRNFANFLANFMIRLFENQLWKRF